MKPLLSLLLCLFLVSCNLGQQTSSAPQAWFDMPLPNTVFLPPNPCHLIAHGASPNGITTFEIYNNGALAFTESVSDSNQTLATLNTACPLLLPGKNVIEVRAQDSSGVWSEFAQTVVFITQRDAATATSPPRTTDTPVSTSTAVRTLTATLIPTSIPTLTPTPPPAGGVTVERVSTNLVYLGGSTCGTQEVTILVRAVAPNGITVVVLFYRFATGNSSSEFESISMKPIGGDLYETTLNPTELLGGIPFEQATLQYQIVVQQNGGDTSLRTPVIADVAVQACGRVTASCSSYTDERTCIANGCNWVNIPGMVPIYECRAP